MPEVSDVRQGWPGLFLEDFFVGQVFDTDSRSLSAGDIQAFAELTGDRNPLHTDADFAAASPFGQVIGHGLLGISILVGLFEDAGIFSGTALAFLGIQDWAFLVPIVAGDDLRARMTIDGVRRSKSDPSRGIVTRRYELFNQDETLVQSGITTVLLRARTSG